MAIRAQPTDLQLGIKTWPLPVPIAPMAPPELYPSSGALAPAHSGVRLFHRPRQKPRTYFQNYEKDRGEDGTAGIVSRVMCVCVRGSFVLIL